MNKKLIITGFARSGTSLITKFLNFNGYDTGGNWVEEDNAGYEDEDFQKLITTFQMNAKTESLILFLINEIKKIDKMVIKHPRVLFNPEFMRIWTLVYPDTCMIVNYREPLHALKSKNISGNIGYFTNISTSELDTKFHSFIDILINLRIKHHILYFPDFLNDYDELYHVISSLGIYIDKSKGRKIWNEIVDFDKVHYK